jgi:hypothetical protein
VVLPAAFVAFFAVLASGTDHGALLGTGAAQAADHSGGGTGGHGGIVSGPSRGGMGDPAIGRGAPRNGGGALGGTRTSLDIGRTRPNGGPRFVRFMLFRTSHDIALMMDR